MNVTFDARDVQRVFRELPRRSIFVVNQLIEASAIDVQREMRKKVNVGATGSTRRSIKYRLDRTNLSAEIYPDSPHAEALEKGTRPHWTSVKEGTPLRQWADHKGINPWAVQASIAKKGTKAHPFVRPTFSSAQRTVPRDIINGFGRFMKEVDSGRI